jgi:hypothetical protein
VPKAGRSIKRALKLPLLRHTFPFKNAKFGHITQDMAVERITKTAVLEVHRWPNESWGPVMLLNFCVDGCKWGGAVVVGKVCGP